MTEKLFTLAKVLETIDSFSEKSYRIYLPTADLPWKVDTPCAVLKHGAPGETDINPAFAVQHRLLCSLSIAQTVDIVTNARSQLPNASSADLVRAFDYYYQHDAFIDFGQN